LFGDVEAQSTCRYKNGMTMGPHPMLDPQSHLTWTKAQSGWYGTCHWQFC